jgi:hypothetical protein
MFFAINIREWLILKTTAETRPGRANIPENADEHRLIELVFC